MFANEAIRLKNKLIQNYEIRLRTHDVQTQEITKMRKTIDDLHTTCANQQEALETGKREHALTTQSLAHEFKCHAATEASAGSLIQHQHNGFQDLIRLLNTIGIPRRADPNDSTGVGTLWLERDSLRVKLEQQKTKIHDLEVELQSVRGNLRHKQLLSDSQNANTESLSMPPNSESSEREVEVKTAVLLPANPQKQRKRTRS